MSHKRAKVEGSPGVQLGLIITPMLDMSFQILAFFIMTYHPAAMEGHITGNLTPPEDFAKKSKDPNPVAPVEPPLSIDEDKLMPELNEVITVQIKSVVKDIGQKQLAGTPSQIFIRQTIDTESELLAGSDTAEFSKTLENLEKRLRAASKSGKAEIKIAGDGGLRYQYLLQVYDTAKKAGFTKIHFVPPPIKSKLAK